MPPFVPEAYSEITMITVVSHDQSLNHICAMMHFALDCLVTPVMDRTRILPIAVPKVSAKEHHPHVNAAD